MTCAPLDSLFQSQMLNRSRTKQSPPRILQTSISYLTNPTSDCKLPTLRTTPYQLPTLPTTTPATGLPPLQTATTAGIPPATTTAAYAAPAAAPAAPPAAQTTAFKKTRFVPRGRRTSPNSTLPCPVCHQLYSRRDNLRTHMRIHSKEKPYSCRECSTRFRWLGALRSHEAMHRRREQRGGIDGCADVHVEHTEAGVHSHRLAYSFVTDSASGASGGSGEHVRPVQSLSTQVPPVGLDTAFARLPRPFVSTSAYAPV